MGLKNVEREVRVPAMRCTQEAVHHAAGLPCCDPGLPVKPEAVINNDAHCRDQCESSSMGVGRC